MKYQDGARPQFYCTDDIAPDSRDIQYGQTPLSRAAEEGHEALIRLLIKQNGVNPDSKNNDGRTPL